MMKNYLLLIIVLFTGQSFASSFDEAFDLSAKGFEKQANKIAGYFNSDIGHDMDYQRQELMLLTSILSEVEEQFKDNPVFWFVKGVHAKNMASFNKQSGNEAKVIHWMDVKTKNYLKAMMLDKENKPHLSAASYAVMKSGLPLPHKQRAVEMELNLGGNGENDSYYWYLHWSNINELQKQNMFKEADEALLRMKQELALSDQADTFSGLVKTVDEELAALKKAAQSKSIKKVQKKSPPVRKHQAFTEEQAEEKYYQYLVLVGIVMAVIIVLLLLFEFKRRKNK